MESNTKINLYTILLLPVLAAIVGGIVMLAMHFLMDGNTAEMQVPAEPVQKSAIALSELADMFRSIFNAG